MLLHGARADAENVADVDAGFSVAQPKQHLGLPIRNLQPQLQPSRMLTGIELVEADQQLVLAILRDENKLDGSEGLLDPHRAFRGAHRQQSLDSCSDLKW